MYTFEKKMHSSTFCRVGKPADKKTCARLQERKWNFDDLRTGMGVKAKKKKKVPRESSRAGKNMKNCTVEKSLTDYIEANLKKIYIETVELFP